MDNAMTRENGWVVIVLPERFNADHLQALEPTFAQLLAEPQPVKLLLDFAEVRYMDSTGIGALIRLYTNFKGKQGRVVAANCRDNVVKIFKLVNLQRYVKLFPTKAEVFASVE